MVESFGRIAIPPRAPCFISRCHRRRPAPRKDWIRPMVESTIFVIDDDEAVRDALCELFASENIPVRAFASAEEFLASDAVASPGCLILDLMMPGMSGIDLQAELIHRGATIPIIIMTGRGDVPKAVTTLKAGAFDFIEKPFDPTALMKVVNQALNREGRLRRRYAEREAVEA